MFPRFEVGERERGVEVIKEGETKNTGAGF